MEVTCSDFIETEEDLNCTINFFSNFTIDFEIEFDNHQQIMTLTPNTNIFLIKNFSTSSYMEFRISSSNSSLELYPLILGNFC